MQRFLRDVSMPAVVAGFVAVLVGYTSAVAIVFQAAQALGADAAQTASWMWALGLAMGVSTIALSAWYRLPALTAWSTPGAALLAGVLARFGLDAVLSVRSAPALVRAPPRRGRPDLPRHAVRRLDGRDRLGLLGRGGRRRRARRATLAPRSLSRGAA